MADNNQIINIPQFDGKNFSNWKYRVRSLLDETNLRKYIEDDIENILESVEAKDKQNEIRLEEERCASILVQTIHDSQLHYVREKKTAKEMFDSLCCIFERKTISEQLKLTKQLLLMKYRDGDDIMEHFNKFNSIVSQSRSNGGSEPEEANLIVSLLLTMPESYSNLVTEIETLRHDDVTLELVKKRLLDEYGKRNGTESSRKPIISGAMHEKGKKKQLTCEVGQNESNGLQASRCLSTVDSKLSYIHHIGKEKLIYKTLGQQLDDTAEKFPNTEGLVSCHERKRYTYSSIRDTADRLAASFLKLGLSQGDRVAIFASNNAHWYLTMMAAARADLVLVGINPALQAPEVEYCLAKVDVKAVVASNSFKNRLNFKILEEICPELRNSREGELNCKKLPNLKAVIIDSPEKWPGALKFDDLLDWPDNHEIQKVRDMQAGIMPDAPCNIQFTSGTTGCPKATVLSHFNLINNGYFNGKRNELEGKRICVQNPLFHAFGTAISISPALCHGSTIVLPTDGFDAEASLRAIMDEKCTVIHGTPTMYVDLIQTQRELKLPIETAEIAVTGGALCSPHLFKDIKNFLGLKKVKSIYGMTESTGVSFQSMLDDDEDKILNTVGHLQDHLEAKVIDSKGNTVPFGQPGELCVRGYSVMLQYLNDEEKTKEAISPCRWLRTGDQFILHENGYGQIVGRLKDMIIRGGENIFPREIEDFLGTHPDVLEYFQ